MVIVIDDESTILRLAERILSRAGHEVLVAESGEAGLALIKDNSRQLDLVILDWTLPGLSGLEVYNEIRKKQKELPIIISSGYQLEQSGCPSEVVSDVTFLEKPYTPADMLNLVKTKAPDLSVD